jgi:hypothetical protein
MGKTALVTLATLVLSVSPWIRAQSVASDGPAATGEVRMPRIRSDDATITALIAQASQGSATFRRFVDLIDATDGIVYVERGRCRYQMGACLVATVKVAGPNRILRIVIDRRKAPCDLNLMASIGHELWHAIEVLREPSIRSDSAFFFFYLREGLHTNRLQFPLGAWETPAADKAGVDVLAELRKANPEKGDPCVHR